MDFRDLVLKTRSYRRYDGTHQITADVLNELIDLARQTPSGSNVQRLKYIACCDPDMNARIFSTLGWAASLPDWPGPAETERPTGYIVVLLDKQVSEDPSQDVGIAAQTILLGAVSAGLGGCMFGSTRKKQLREILGLADHLEIVLVISLGRPVENVVLEDLEPGQATKYYRDEDQTHHVPKRSLKEVLVKLYSP